MQPNLHIIHDVNVDIHQFLHFEPDIRIVPQLRRARLIRRLLVDLILQDTNMVHGQLQESVPSRDDGLEDIVQKSLGALHRELLIIVNRIPRLKRQVKGEPSPAGLPLLPGADEAVVDAAGVGVVEDDDGVAVVEGVEARDVPVLFMGLVVVCCIAALAVLVGVLDVRAVGDLGGDLLVLDVAADALDEGVVAVGRVVCRSQKRRTGGNMDGFAYYITGLLTNHSHQNNSTPSTSRCHPTSAAPRDHTHGTPSNNPTQTKSC